MKKIQLICHRTSNGIAEKKVAETILKQITDKEVSKRVGWEIPNIITDSIPRGITEQVYNGFASGRNCESN